MSLINLNRSNNFLLFVFLLLQLSYSFSFGNFSVEGFFLIAGVTVFLIFYSTFGNNITKNFLDIDMSKIVFLILMVLSIFFFERTTRVLASVYYPEGFSQMLLFSRLIFFISLIFAVGLTAKNSKIIFISLIAINLILKFFILIMAPEPYVDIFDILKKGANAVLSFENPYTIEFLKYYSFGPDPDFYTYLPASFILLAPVVGLFKDPRTVYLLADLVSAFCIYKITSKFNPQLKFILPLILLFTPMSFYVMERAYLEPLLIGLISLFFYLILRTNRMCYAAFLLGFTLAVKQSILLLPFFLFRWIKNLKFWAITFFTFLIIVLPFAFFSFEDFIHDVLLVLLEYPVRHDALTFNTLIFYFLKKDLPIFTYPIVWFFSFLLLFVKRFKSLSELLLTYCIWYLIFGLFNKIAFAEFYFFCSFLIILSVATVNFKKINL